jgi:poly(3-hydroxybutyrate) depolymerase
MCNSVKHRALLLGFLACVLLACSLSGQKVSALLAADGNTITGALNQGSFPRSILTSQASVPASGTEITTKFAFEFAGKSRTYYLFTPGGEGPLPLVVLLHGSGRNGQTMIDAWSGLASKEHFSIVAPDAYDSSGWSVKIDSPEFLRAVVEQVKARHAVDESRIYLFGHSAGAVHALVIAIIDSRFYAATAVHAGAIPPGYEKLLFSRAERRMPIAIWVGAEDPLFPVDAVTATKQSFEQNGFQVNLSIIPNHDHNYYAISDQVNSNAWDFLRKVQLAREAATPSQAFQGHTLRASTFPELPVQKLKEAVPDLKGLNYDASQNRLPVILAGVAQTIANVLPRLPDLASREQIYHFQSTLDVAGAGGPARQPWSREFKYLLLCHHNADGSTTIEESRTDSKGRIATASGPMTSLRGHGFAYLWLLFSAANQPEFRFRYLGQQHKGGRETFVVAFAQDPGKVADPAYFQSGQKVSPYYYQGILWVDQSSFDIVMLRTDLLDPLPALQLRELTMELTFRSVPIQGYNAVFWLPLEVDITLGQGVAPGEFTGPAEGTFLYQENHVYSNYQLFHGEARIVLSP